MIKQRAKKLLNSIGLELRRTPPPADAKAIEAANRTTFRGALRQMRKLGLTPRTVIDVGVAFETRELYEEFSDSQILLVEPLIEFEPFLQRICAEYHAQYVLAAAGESPGTISLNVHKDQLDCSSVFHEAEGSQVDGEPREVHMATLDELCEERGLTGPYLLKVDVQGAELRVLAGAKKILRECDAVILEATLFGTMIGGPQLAEVVAYMQGQGFATYDIWGMLYRPLDGALAQVDIAFVREDSVLRESQGFATEEQRRKFAWDLRNGKPPQ